MSVHIAIGNTDNRLTQQEWAEFYDAVDQRIRMFVESANGTVHGRWVSPSTAPFQNACWAFTGGHQESLIEHLSHLAQRFRQESIAWTEGDTVYIEGGHP